MTVIETDKQQVEKIVRAFANELLQQLGGQIYEIIWYGSTARGDAAEDSDIDVAVISESDDFATEDRIWSIASDVSLEYDTLIDARVISHKRFYGEWGRLSYLAEDIQNEGVLIWKRNVESMATN
ncbi:nucleotidyltransferase domain-containing protein [candidate division KSB1 bacterium]|nr:nucleotidyltransferase domain-containing protein [candidate division KSB1 bacterium]